MNEKRSRKKKAVFIGFLTCLCLLSFSVVTMILLKIFEVEKISKPSELQGTETENSPSFDGDYFTSEDVNVEISYEFSAPVTYHIGLTVQNDEKTIEKNFDTYMDDRRSLEISSDLKYLTIIGETIKIIEIKTMEEKEIVLPENFKKDEYNFVWTRKEGSFEDLGISTIKKLTPSRNWNGDYFIFAFSHCSYTPSSCGDEDGEIFNHEDHLENSPKDIIFIFNKQKDTLTQLLVPPTTDFRYGATNSSLYSYGSWGVLENEILFYTTFYQNDHSIDNPGEDSVYGVKFVNLKNTNQTKELYVKEYSYPEVISLDHYIIELQLDVKSFSFTDAHGSFLYRFMTPEGEVGNEEFLWSDWMEYEY